MASKIKMIQELLIGAFIDFVPDGSNIGTVEVPSLTSKTAKPTTDEVWREYNIGRSTSSKYDPKTKDLTPREWSNESGGYSERTDSYVTEDAFLVKSVDFNELYHRLMFGLADEIEDDTAQTLFEKSTRYLDGWTRITRRSDDGSILCQFEMHARYRIAEFPEDKNEKGSPGIRIVHLKDADQAMEPIVFNPVAA